MMPGMWKVGYCRRYGKKHFLEGVRVSQIGKFYEDIANICRLSHATAAECFLIIKDYHLLKQSET